MLSVQGESALLIGESQVSGVEMKNCHEETCSAAPVAQNEFSSSQVEREVELNQPASLSRENQATGEEVKSTHEGESSAASVPSTEKWSHEAIVARSNMRPERMQKLKVAANSWQNPGFDFLEECWNDDPALQIAIEKVRRDRSLHSDRKASCGLIHIRRKLTSPKEDIEFWGFC